MGSFALLDVTTYVAGFDFTGTMNSLALNNGDQELDTTVFGSQARKRISGIEDTDASLQGFWEAGAGTVDPEAFGKLGGARQVVSHSPTGVAGSTSYFYEAAEYTYNLFGEIGVAAPYTLSLMGASGNNSPGMIRGQLAAAKGNVSTVGALGSAVNLGAGSAGKFLYSTIHVFTAGTTVTIEIQSDDASGFATPTTRATFPAITTVGGTWLTRVDVSAVADTWWRFNIPAAGITGTFNLAASLGIK